MDASPNKDEEADLLRENIARDNGIQLFRKYSEEQAANFLDLHAKSLKELRLQGKVGCIRLGPRKISYLGLQIVDFIVENIQWANAPKNSTASVNIGSRGGTGLISSTDTGTTNKERSRVAHRSALQALKTPRKS